MRLKSTLCVEERSFWLVKKLVVNQDTLDYVDGKRYCDLPTFSKYILVELGCVLF